MKILIFFILSLLVFAIVISGCSSKQTTEISQPLKVTEPLVVEKKGNEKGVSVDGESASVIIKGFKFVPNEIKVKKGTTVTWRNEDSAAHTIESVDGTLNSDNLEQGDTVIFTFDKVGKIDYICGIHPSMKGSITVE